MSRWLVVGDVDQVQSFVFDSTRLRAIRGASALLEESVWGFGQRVNGDHVSVLRARGGQFVAVVDDERRPTLLCRELEAAVSRASAGLAHITTTAVPYDADFQSAMTRAIREIRGEKDGRQDRGAGWVAILSGPYFRRCQLIPSQPASSRLAPEERYLSPAARLRWDGVEKRKDLLDRPLLEELQMADRGLARGRRRARLPYDLDDLFSGREGGYLAFVAADGNGIGQLLEVIDTEDLYKRFTDELGGITLASVARAARDAGIMGAATAEHIPLIPIIIAGDDMSFLVRQEHAIRFAWGLMEAFSDLSSERARQPGGSAIQEAVDRFCRSPDHREVARRLYPSRFDAGGEVLDGPAATGPSALSLSVGVAIARRTFPISAYHRLATQLRDSAKRALRRRSAGAEAGGAIDFAVITSASAQSLDDLRARYQLEGGAALTARPFTRREFRDLHALAKVLGDLPRSKRKYLYHEVFAGEARGEDACNSLLGRGPSRDRTEAALGLLGCGGGSIFRGEGGPGPRATPLIDALELIELIGDEEGL